jgi:hypothetical protein
VLSVIIARTEVVARLRLDLAEQETIAQEPVHAWGVGESWESLTSIEQDQYRRVCMARRNVDRFKTVLGHLRALWPDEFETKKGSRT